MSNPAVKVLIDPRLRLVFGSYYITGFWEHFGASQVSFSRKPFEGLDMITDPDSFNHYVAFKILDGKREIKVVIDYRDKLTIDEGGYDWCDVYGKKNLNAGKTDKRLLEKSVALGPMIGLKIWNRPTTYYHCIRNYLRGKSRMDVSWRYYLSGYNWQSRRPELSVYEPGEAVDRYIYFDSSLWRHEDWARETNEWRAEFMRACKQADVDFVGGFFGYKDHPDYEKFKDVLLENYINSGQWLDEVKKSVLVFNTPSVHGGHGWKLCEFLALGKAMVSSPILNDLPVALEHGKNIHFVQSKEELKDAINLVSADTEYRKKLEKGARDYYLEYLTPSRMIQRLLEGWMDLEKK